MIDVAEALRGVPRFERFRSVADLDALAARLASDPRFHVEQAGTSARGRPIWRVRFGTGSVKALFVGFPHPMEPVGGLTAHSLLTLLDQGCETLTGADVEWNVVPCIDPDATVLNEPWTQDFGIETFLRNYFLQSARDQADMSFPIAYKKLVVDDPSPEARVLKDVVDRVGPDFYATLHNTRFGGAFLLASRDLGAPVWGRVHDLLRDLGFPVQTRAPWKEVGERYADGVGEVLFTRKVYDYLETVTPSPETYELIRYGGESWDYLQDTRPGAFTLLPELGCLRHPWDESEEPTAWNLRRLMLRVDADSKHLAAVLLDEWEALRDELDPASPFHRAILGGTMLPRRATLLEGGWPMSRYPTREILAKAAYDRVATRADVFNACVVDGGYYFIQWAYPFLRLLRSAPPSARVETAIARCEAAFDEARAALGEYLDIHAFRLVDLDTLAKVQLGACLITLDAVLTGRAA